MGNGTWNGLVGMIMRNEVHVVNVDMTWTADRRNVVDFVTQIYQVKYVTNCLYFFNIMYRASFIILYYDQQMQNYFTNYGTATCFDIIVLSSGSL
jgi:hypothetical protein